MSFPVKSLGRSYFLACLGGGEQGYTAKCRAKYSGNFMFHLLLYNEYFTKIQVLTEFRFICLFFLRICFECGVLKRRLTRIFADYEGCAVSEKICFAKIRVNSRFNNNLFWDKDMRLLFPV